jgi:hypothetical protein
MIENAGRQSAPILALVREDEVEPAPRVAFCSHCGAHPEHELESRVCANCSLGLILQANAELAPNEGDAFLVIDDCMSVCAVSATAERLLAANETDAVNRHVTELVVPADAEAAGAMNLAVAITWAARGTTAAQRVVVRPANTFGVRMAATISSCGPPRAALIKFD